MAISPLAPFGSPNSVKYLIHHYNQTHRTCSCCFDLGYVKPLTLRYLNTLRLSGQCRLVGAACSFTCPDKNRRSTYVNNDAFHQSLHLTCSSFRTVPECGTRFQRFFTVTVSAFLLIHRGILVSVVVISWPQAISHPF